MTGNEMPNSGSQVIGQAILRAKSFRASQI